MLFRSVRGRNYPVISGSEALMGATGVVTAELNPHGMVRVRGEEWTASTESGTIAKGDPVRVVGIQGLRLQVVKK